MLCEKGDYAGMVKGKLTIAILVTALSALALTACYRTPEQRAERMVDHMASELKLNAAQKIQLDKIKDEFMARRPRLAKEREAAVREANELMRSADVDKTKLAALVERSKGQADDMIGFIASKFTEIHDMLTPEQRERLVDHIEKYTDHKDGRGETIKSSAGGGY
jgi:Spy/CpxP family protein refolding chaperone